MNLKESNIWNLYGHLMFHSEIHESETEEQTIFKNDFIKLRDSLTQIEVKELLNDSNWRYSLVGAWIVFSLNKEEFKDDIGKFLNQGKAGVIGYLFVLAKFGDEISANYIIEYLIKELTFKTFPEQRFQDTAYVALLFIDELNNKKYHDKIQDLWTIFISTPYFRNKTFAETELFGNINNRLERFKKIYKYMNELK